MNQEEFERYAAFIMECHARLANDLKESKTQEGAFSAKLEEKFERMTKEGAKTDRFLIRAFRLEVLAARRDTERHRQREDEWKVKLHRLIEAQTRTKEINL